MIRPGDLGYRLDHTGDGGMPTVIILRCQPSDEEGAVLEYGGEGVVVEEFWDCEAVPFDPEFLGEGDGWKGS